MATFRFSAFADEYSKDFDEQIKGLLENDLHLIEPRGIDGTNISDLTSEKAMEVKSKLDAAGIGISALGSPIGKIKITDDFEAHKVKLRRTCEIAKILGANRIRMFSFFMPKDCEDYSPYRDEVMARIGAMLDIADEYEIQLCHENEKGIYGDTGKRCREIYDAMRGTSLVAVYDFANYVQCDEDPVACYELVKDYIAYVHVKDAVFSDHHNVLCATGDGQIPKILTDLEARGYDGFLTMEPHLRVFESLKDLEATVHEETVKEAYPSGVAAYTAQYNALCAVLDGIGVK